MKFNYIVGNPPYQQETTDITPENNGQIRTRSIFHYFQMEADKIAKDATVLIYPGGRWIHRSGKGMEQFGKDQINDIKLKRIDFYPNSSDLFTGVAIGDGVSIVCKDMNKKDTGFVYCYHEGTITEEIEMDNPGNELIPLNPKDSMIVKKITSFVKKYNLAYLHDRILSQKLFGIESDFVEKNPSKVRLYTDDSQIDFNKEIKLFTNDKGGKAGRARWYVTNRTEVKQNNNLIAEWQVVVSSANAGGQKRDNQLEIIDNHSAFGRARVALSSFKTYDEAKHFYDYCNTWLIKFAFLMTDEALTSLGKKVPDLLDYSSHNKCVDFSKDINGQLYKLIELTDDEIDYLENKVKNWRGK